MPLPLVWSDWSDRRFPFRSGYFHRIPAASLKNFSIRTGVCSLWHGCMFLCVDNLYSLHIRRPLLLIHNRSYFSAFLGKAALTSFQHGMYRYLLFHHTPASSPLFSERESASRHHFGSGVSKTSINIFLSLPFAVIIQFNSDYRFQNIQYLLLLQRREHF